MQQHRQLVAQHLTEPRAELLGLVGRIGPLGDDPVHDPGRPHVERADALGPRHVGRVGQVAVHDRAGALGRQRRQPGVLRRDHPVGRQQGEGAATGPLAEQQAERRRVEGDQVREAPGDLAGEPALLGLHRQGGPAGVDHGHQRQVQLGREAHPPPGLAQRPGPERVRRRLAAPVLAEEHARRPAEPREGDEQPRVRLALPGAVERDDVRGGVPQQTSYAGTLRTPRPGDRVPGVDVLDLPVHGVGRVQRHVVAGQQHGQRPVEDRGDLLRRDHGVDQAVGVEVLRRLDAVGERLLVERLVDPRPEEADQRTGLRDGHVTQRAPRRHHPTGRRVAEVDEVGQPGRLVRGDGRGDLHHLHEGDRALLHPGAARHGGGQQGQALGGGSFDRAHQPLGRRDADRARQEPELAGHDRDPAAAHQALAGDHRLVEAGLLLRGGELRGVGVGDRAALRRGVPRRPGAGVEDEVDELGGGEACGCHEDIRP